MTKKKEGKKKEEVGEEQEEKSTNPFYNLPASSSYGSSAVSAKVSAHDQLILQRLWRRIKSNELTRALL